MKIKHKTPSFLFISILFLSPGVLLADIIPSSRKTINRTPTATASSPAQTTNSPPTSNSSDFKVSGYIEPSYNYLLHSNHFIRGSQDRVFDLEQDGFTLQQAAISAVYQPTDGFGGLLNFIVGRDPLTFAPFGENTKTGIHHFGYNLLQAFLQYQKKSLTVIGGQFGSLTGQEDVNPSKDSNVSNSILSLNEPGTFLGIRATYVINDKWSTNVGINNGWDNVRDFSRRKTIELGLVYTMTDLFSLSVQGTNGEERSTPMTASGPEGQRSIIDLIATYTPTKQLSLIDNYDYAMQTNAALPNGTFAKAVWQGIAGYVNYKFNDKWHSSFRGEIFSDRNGFRTGIAQYWKELTLTIGYFPPIKNLELRAETRHDFLSKNSIVNTDGIGVSNNQQSFALQAIYSFP